MGDRCHMELTCRKADMPKFEELGFVENMDHDKLDERVVFEVFPGCVEMTDEEANYAHANDMPTNVPYFGRHSNGDNYPGARFACNGKKLVEHYTCEGALVVQVNDKGDINEEEVFSARRVLRMEVQAKRALRHAGFNGKP